MMKKIVFLAICVVFFFSGEALAARLAKALSTSIKPDPVCAGFPPGRAVYINGFDAAYPPFSFIDKAGNPAGFDIDAVNWIANEMGFKVKHQPTDWAAIVPSLKAGKIDFIASGMS